MPTERSRLQTILHRHGLRAAKGLGQHFLVDEEILRAIARATGAGPDADVVEVGAGVGNLTTLLALSGARVTSIEIDPKFQSLHREIQITDPDFRERLQFHYGDALEFDYVGAAARAQADGRRFLIAGNIPYQITSPLIMGILDSGARFDSMTFLVQREVAERLTAAPGSRKNGAITIKVQYDCEARTLMDVPARAFLPPPEVDSQVIQMRLRQTGTGGEGFAPGLRPRDEAERRALFRLVDAAFAHRRKMLSNSVSAAGLGYTKPQVDQALQQIGFTPSARAEELGVTDFVALMKALES